MANEERRRMRIVWAVVGAVVLVGALIAILVATQHGTSNDPDPSPSTPAAGSPAPPHPPSGDLVDPSVAERGWVPEPITRDPDVYARAALEAVGTFDTREATRGEWLSWLDSWFTPSPLYENPQDALDQMTGYQAELDQSVVLPQQMWDDLASEDGRVTAEVTSDIDYLELPETTAQNMLTASADVVLHYARTADGQDVSYEETVRVSVQVVCDGASVPTPGSAQQAGDCKVVRFFDQAVS